MLAKLYQEHGLSSYLRHSRDHHIVSARFDILCYKDL